MDFHGKKQDFLVNGLNDLFSGSSTFSVKQQDPINTQLYRVCENSKNPSGRKLFYQRTHFFYKFLNSSDQKNDFFSQAIQKRRKISDSHHVAERRAGALRSTVIL